MSWRSQAFLALIAHPDVQHQRNLVVRRLSTELAHTLGFISQDGAFMKSIHKQIVDPAMRLHEKFLTSTRRFYLYTNSRFRAGKRFDGDLSHLKSLDCVDIARNNRKFVIDKLNPQPSIEEVRKNLRMVCSTRPALMVIEAGRQGKLKDPAIVCKEVMQVAWNSGERQSTLKKDQQSGSSAWLRTIVSAVENVRH